MANLHTIIPSATAGLDPYGGFPKNCPNGSGFSVKLGNETATTNGGIGKEASGISYTYTIPATVSIFSVFFYYAVVLQNPGHTVEEQPRFRARIKDISTGTLISCVSFDFIASSSLGGFLPSPLGQGVLYKDWTPVTLELSGLAGRTIEVEFIATECTQGGHFAYAYVDVNSNCNGAISGTTICQGNNSVNLTAPFGFQSYEWYSDNTFSTLLTNTQTLALNPAPSVGAVLPVIVIPYPGFGCRDTLEATISVAAKPVSNAGPDVSICKYQTAQLGGSPTPGYNYVWRPANLVSNTVISNPIGWNIAPDPSEIIVKTTDILTGCFSEDTVYVSNIDVEKTITLTGNAEFCNGESNAILSVSNSSTGIQWHNAALPITGATSFTFLPLISGDFWASLIQSGCKDSTTTIPIVVHPLPQASFFPNEDTLCATNNIFQFNNTSASPDNAALSYNWKFSDGTSQQIKDAVKTFDAVGNYKVKLITTTIFDCKDSTSSTVYVLPNGVPDFTLDSICLNRPVLFKNLSSENGSNLVNYKWNFNNGGQVSTIKNPLPIVYSIPGKASVTLELTTLGCDTDPKSISKEVQVNPGHTAIRYRDITVPQGNTRYIHVRDSVGSIFNWRPQIQLSQYNKQYTEFFATGDDVRYLVDITDTHTCVTTDTILMQILKKPGYYLPTAFTPNGDGLNDRVRPYLIGMQQLKSFSVFNRWGTLIFYTTKEGDEWDGKYKGVELDNGVYVWILEFINGNNIKVTEKGTIAIVR
jgi:gliding motility-associated-like protein